MDKYALDRELNEMSLNLRDMQDYFEAAYVLDDEVAAAIKAIVAARTAICALSSFNQ